MWKLNDNQHRLLMRCLVLIFVFAQLNSICLASNQQSSKLIEANKLNLNLIANQNNQLNQTQPQPPSYTNLNLNPNSASQTLNQTLSNQTKKSDFSEVQFDLSSKSTNLNTSNLNSKTSSKYEFKKLNQSKSNEVNLIKLNHQENCSNESEQMIVASSEQQSLNQQFAYSNLPIQTDAGTNNQKSVHTLDEKLSIQESRTSESVHTNQLKLVCYYANWAVYRPGLAKFTPQNINPKLCTHIIYAFGGLSSKYEMKAFDPYNDINQGNYKKFTGLKVYNKNLKTMIAIGGWNEGSKRFSKLVADEELRQTFVDSVVKFLRQNQFDGLDLDWEYPAFRDGSSENDKENYVKLVEQLREAFEKESQATGKERLLLSIAVPAGQDYIDNGIDVPKISKNVDFMNLLSYDYYTSYDPETGHHSPLSAHDQISSFDEGKKLNVEWTVNYYIEKGAPRNKIIVGVPTYGRSFTLAEANNHLLKSVAEGPGEQGLATREKGYLAYFEICQKINEEKWKVENPYPKNLGPYAHSDKQWVGYDNIDSIKMKAAFVLENNLGGAMVWTLDNDDFRGLCGSQQSPLIHALKEALFNKKTNDIFTTQTNPASDKLSKPFNKLENNIRKQLNSRRPTFATSTSLPTTTSTTTRTIATTTTTTTKTTPKSTSTSETSEAAANNEPEFTTPDPGIDFKCEDEGFFKNPKDCKKYFWCLDSGPANLGIVAHSFTCPQGLFFNPQTEACDYPANVQGCKSDKKSKKKKKIVKPLTTTTATTEAPEITSTTARSTITQRNTPIRRRTTTTTTTPATSKIENNINNFDNIGNNGNNGNNPPTVNNQITPELLAAALKLAREQEQSSTVTSGPSNDHLFQLLQLVKSLGGVDKVQELLNTYNLNKNPNHSTFISDEHASPNSLTNNNLHHHHSHLTDGANNLNSFNLNNNELNLNKEDPSLITRNSNSKIENLSNYGDVRQNSRTSLRQQQPNSNLFNPSYQTPRRQVEPILTNTQSPLIERFTYPSINEQPIISNVDLHNNLPTMNTVAPVRYVNQRRPQKIEQPSTTTTNPEVLFTDPNYSSSRSQSPFNFVYNEPMLRNTVVVQPQDNLRINTNSNQLDNSSIDQPLSRTRSRQKHRNSNTGERISPASNTNEATNVDGFFLYNVPVRDNKLSAEPLNTPERNVTPKAHRNRSKPKNNGNSYNVRTSNERIRSTTNPPNLDSAQSSTSTNNKRSRKPARVRIQTGFVVAETPVSPGVTYDEEADIIVLKNKNLSSQSVHNRIGNSQNKPSQTGTSENINHSRNTFAHHHNHNSGEELRLNSNLFDANPNLSNLEIPPEPTIIARKPSSLRRRPPQRAHILNNPNILSESISLTKPQTSHENVFPKFSDEDTSSFLHNKHITTLNPFSTFGLPNYPEENDHDSNRFSINQPIDHASIHDLADEIERLPEFDSIKKNSHDLENNYEKSIFNQPSSEFNPTLSNYQKTTPIISSYVTETFKSSSVTESTLSNTYPIITTTLSPSNTVPNVSQLKPSSVRSRSRSRQNLNSSTSTVNQPKNDQPLRTNTTSKQFVNNITSTPSQLPKTATYNNNSSGQAIVWDQALNKITCNKRGVHPHPQSCGQFVVCAPSKSEIKAYSHHCPAQQVFVKEVGRCRPGNREKCESY